ncbi:MAG: TIGR03089 family protein, partial [Dermacoccus nishinomiyaensis]
MTTRTPWQVLEHLVATDQTAPRVTFYERTPGPTQGERIELSAKVLTNWVSKAANLLSEELDVDASSSVIVHLPAAHWRTAYWCLAVWSLGAQVVFVDADDDD